jgi:hypothetical protein
LIGFVQNAPRFLPRFPNHDPEDFGEPLFLAMLRQPMNHQDYRHLRDLGIAATS